MLKITTRTPLKAADNSNFLTSEVKLAFLWLKQAFIKALIFYHFDLKYYIWIEIDIFGYIISGIFSQPILKSGQWHFIPFFFKKMILAKTWYKTYNQKFLAIIKIFKTWRYYLKSFKFEVFILTDHNNLC